MTTLQSIDGIAYFESQPLWSKKLANGTFVWLYPCVNAHGETGYAMILGGEAEAVLAIWYSPGEPDWMAEVDGATAEWGELGLLEEDVYEINRVLEEYLGD